MRILLTALLAVVLGGLFAMTEMEFYQQVVPLYEAEKFNEAAALVETYLKEAGETGAWQYTLACLHALGGASKKAYAALERAVELGWLNLDALETDTDLASLRKGKRWNKLVANVKGRIEQKLDTLPETRVRADSLLLPPPLTVGTVSVEEALQQRRSVREYDPSPLTLEEVSQLLWAAYGVTYELAPKMLRGGLKTAPSAGATYPLEIYLAAGNVEGLAPGIYQYEPWGHKLFKVLDGDLREELCAACLGQEWILYAPASLIYSAVFSRTTGKYSDRGRPRYVCMDLGHSGENVYLQSEALGLGTVAIGAFDDLELRLLVNMTREEEPLYVMPVGRKPVEEIGE